MSTHSIPEGFTAVARLLKPYALRGEVKAQCMSFDFFRYKDLCNVQLWNSQSGKLFSGVIEKAYDRNDFWYLKFKDYDSPEKSNELRFCEVLVPDSERPQLPEGQFYFSDLAGLKAVDFNGKDLGGILVEAREGAASDILCFDFDGKELLAPWVKECIGNISLANKTIEIDLDYFSDVYDFLKRS